MTFQPRPKDGEAHSEVVNEVMREYIKGLDLSTQSISACSSVRQGSTGIDATILGIKRGVRRPGLCGFRKETQTTRKPIV